MSEYPLQVCAYSDVLVMCYQWQKHLTVYFEFSISDEDKIFYSSLGNRVSSSRMIQHFNAALMLKLPHQTSWSQNLKETSKVWCFTWEFDQSYAISALKWHDHTVQWVGLAIEKRCSYLTITPIPVAYTLLISLCLWSFLIVGIFSSFAAPLFTYFAFSCALYNTVTIHAKNRHI